MSEQRDTELAMLVHLAAVTGNKQPAMPPYRHDCHPWCQPGDRPHQTWVLIFDDPDRRMMVWTDEFAEQDAREAWNRYAPTWNCTLLCTAPL